MKIFFVAILRSKPNLYIIIGGPNQMKVVILTQKCPERIVKLGTLDVGMKKRLEIPIKTAIFRLKISYEQGVAG